MTQPARRRLEQPSAEKARRSGCLMWGAVLGVLVGIMVGIYALPPILKHYYGETVVAPDEFYRGDGRAIRVISVSRASDPVGEPSPGIRREDFFVTVAVVSEEPWTTTATDFSLEFEEIEEWQVAEQGEPFGVPAGVETRLELHFVVELPADEADSFTVEALHLSDPRVKFEVARP